MLFQLSLAFTLVIYRSLSCILSQVRRGYHHIPPALRPAAGGLGGTCMSWKILDIVSMLASWSLMRSGLMVSARAA